MIISPQTFSAQLEAGTISYCLSQCIILFCTLSAWPHALLFPLLSPSPSSTQDIPYTSVPSFHTGNIQLPSLSLPSLVSLVPLHMSSLYYSISQTYFGEQLSPALLLLFLAVSGQMPKPLTISTNFSFSSF